MTQGDGVSTLNRRQLYFLQSGFDLLLYVGKGEESKRMVQQLPAYMYMQSGVCSGVVIVTDRDTLTLIYCHTVLQDLVDKKTDEKKDDEKNCRYSAYLCCRNSKVLLFRH